MVAPHIADCYSVIIVKFLSVYLPLRDLIVIYRFLSLYMFTKINKLIAEDSYCSYRFSVHFLLDCLCYSASCTKSGNFWTLRLGTLQNNHNTPGLSISFQFYRKLTKHLLYHIANFDCGTQCVIWGVICIFMKSTSCSSGCAPSPWTWSVLHIIRTFCKQWTKINNFLRLPFHLLMVMLTIIVCCYGSRLVGHSGTGWYPVKSPMVARLLATKDLGGLTLSVEEHQRCLGQEIHMSARLLAPSDR